ncbi:virulence factor TspB C-terminal domain-related protein [Nitrosomonas europaea]|uniref:TspB protein n=1 Tax=Nitrosomonas europaea (strain ATCC 19718 / CIP 103999 / KCTC 2705 / NBRC 14298) TaxID=228410 RepID=Q82W08_NITEU|nr:virulence factor TspB C-terminal domain-related protein [Nitrosomonas europaea]CAD84802.1 hypothetical protein NE0891 [Nitrosomonas europaea ATCC 19718]SDW17322.1 hypothetical protein SAMN05216310_10479 [Nitrosomonas europaea]SJZ33942.1 hypothetical protein SAMN02745113_00533 [Nitrosomonas europaea]
MDTVRKLIVCAILGVFYVPVVSAYEFHDPYPNVKVIDGEVHIQRPGGGTSLAYPNAGISKDIPVNTSKGQFLVPVEKTFPVEPSKVGKAATRFLKTLPAIGTAIALYDTVCDLTDICRNSQSGEIEYAPDMPAGYPVTTETGYWRHPFYVSLTHVTADLLCKSFDYRAAVHFAPNNLTFLRVEVSGGTSYCIYSDKTNNPPTETAPPNYSIVKVNSGNCFTGYTKVGNECVHNNAPVPVTETHWTDAETKLNAQPQQTAEALYNSDAPVPVLASTQSAPVIQQIAQTSTQTKDAQGNITGTQVATTSVKVEDTSTTNNVTYNVTEVTTITTYNENNEITNTQTSTSDNSPPKTGTDETTVSFDDVPPAQLEEEQPEFNLQTPESWGEGTCPPDEILTVQGVTFPVSWQPACDTAVQLRPIFVLFASVAAMFIVAGISRAGT